jgi:membrane fusion protein (multidrug efflux system)
LLYSDSFFATSPAEHKAHAALQAAQRQLDVIDTEKQQTEAALAQAKAERDLASLNLGYTEIRSPIDGVVGNRSARVGAYATVSNAAFTMLHRAWPLTALGIALRQTRFGSDC